MLPAGALQPVTDAHLEITPEFTPASGQWNWIGYWIDENLENQATNINEVGFEGLDATSANGGLRGTQPSTPQWAFTGAASGQTFWRFRDSTLTTPGLGANPSNMSNNAMTISLHSVQGPAGGFFSMYFSNSSPVAYFRTDDGIDATDSFSKPLNHTHYNWAFTKKGLWIVNLTAQGILNTTGQPTPVSPPQPFVFAIGDFARWKAASFNMAELQNPQISGDPADPDSDGFSNLMEYALGGDCRVPSARRTQDALPMAPELLRPAYDGAPWRFCYFRRIAGQQEPLDITYQVESSPSPAAPSWSPETGTEEILASDTEWQRVAIPVSGGTSRFFRLKAATVP